MVLDETLIRQIFKDNANKVSLDYKKEKSKTLRAHITGLGADTLITQIEGFERKNIAAARKKMMLTNVDIVNRVLLPRRKIYTAKGGVEIYNLTTPEKTAEFQEYLSNITGDGSLKEYVRDVIQKRVDYDPEGLKWVDINADGVPYPNFKSIQCIYEWQLNGRKLEYVFFECSKSEIKYYILNDILDKSQINNKIYRVVCDGYDRLMSVGGGGTEDVSFPYVVENVFGYVPGEILSNIPGEEGDSDTSYTCYQSPLHPAIELLANFMFQRSIFNIAFSRVAYPKEWMNKFTCPTCLGTKKVDGQKCPECNGTGAIPILKNSDVAIVEYSNDINKNVPNPPMGTIEAPVESLQFMKDNNISLEEMIYYTIYGMFNSMPGMSARKSGQTAKGGNVSNTAFEANLNDQPKRDTLRTWGNWVSNTIKWYVDVCGSVAFKDSYISSAILMGDRYMEESSDVTFDRLDKARQGGAPKSMLNSLMEEYLENKYQNNPLGYWKAWVRYIAEPFMWDKVTDVMSWQIPMTDKLKKIYFDEWIDSLDDDYYTMLPREDTEQVVKADLEKYMLTRYQKGFELDQKLFMTNMGQLLMIGDNVTVRKEKEMMPGDSGKIYRISSATESAVTLVDDDNNTVTGYSRADIQKTSDVRGGEPYGFRSAS